MELQVTHLCLTPTLSPLTLQSQNHQKQSKANDESGNKQSLSASRQENVSHSVGMALGDSLP